MAGRYRVLRRIARGELSELWLAEEERTALEPRLIVLQRLHSFVVQQYEGLDRLRASVTTERSRRHENLVEIYDVTIDEHLGLIAREYVPGRDLAQVLRRAKNSGRTVPFAFAAGVAYEVSRALEYANEIHRDLCPRHVLIGCRGEVKIRSFSPPSAWRTTAGLAKGRYSYMSPEQVRGDQLDTRTDIFSLGIMLWEMCAERRLFNHPSELRTLEAIRDAEVPRLSEVSAGVPKALEAIIHRALERRPGDRFRTVAEMRSALEAVPRMVKEQRAAFMQELFRQEIEAEDLLAQRPGDRSEARALEACIAHNPSAPDPYLVYADWLQQHGDPRGELIVIDHALRDKGTVVGNDQLKRVFGRERTSAEHRALADRETELFQKLGPTLLGELFSAAHMMSDVVWRYSFIRELTLTAVTADEAKEAITTLAWSTSGRFVRVLRLRVRGIVRKEELGLHQLTCLEHVELEKLQTSGRFEVPDPFDEVTEEIAPPPSTPTDPTDPARA